uniref:Secreted protein n=1 Tax=Panagrellus redivivus TaxID=6233 RepID=A0A7E4VSB5_PANRE
MPKQLLLYDVMTNTGGSTIAVIGIGRRGRRRRRLEQNRYTSAFRKVDRCLCGQAKNDLITLILCCHCKNDDNNNNNKCFSNG